MSASIVDLAAKDGSGAVLDAPATEHARSSLPVRMVRDIRLLLIAFWFGASVFFSFVLAPTVFLVLPAREWAGAVVARTLSIINASGFIIGLVLLASVILFRKMVSRSALVLEMVALVTITLSTFFGKWIIAAQMQALRTAMGRPIDEIAQSDPLRIAFNSLHGYSVTALSIAMVAAMLSLLLIARRAGR